MRQFAPELKRCIASHRALHTHAILSVYGNWVSNIRPGKVQERTCHVSWSSAPGRLCACLPSSPHRARIVSSRVMYGCCVGATMHNCCACSWCPHTLLVAWRCRCASHCCAGAPPCFSCYPSVAGAMHQQCPYCGHIPAVSRLLLSWVRDPTLHVPAHSFVHQCEIGQHVHASELIIGSSPAVWP
jgi:hypothetical protein